MNSRSISALLLVAGVASAVSLGLLLRPTPAAPGQDAPPAFSTSDQGSWNSSRDLVRREVVLMGTSFVFVVEGREQQAAAAIQAAERRMRELDDLLTSWRPGSEISLLNARAGLGPVKVSAETLRVLRLSQQLHARTGGAFDVTIGPAWDLWPFRDPERPLPTAAELQAAVRLVGADHIQFGADTAFLPEAGMKLNLGAVGKGYAAGAAIEVLKAHGVTRAAVSAGGDLYLLGRKTTGPWVVGIDHPLWEGQYIEQFAAGDIAIATSGNTQRFIERDGRRYGHILDPRTGRPVDHCLSVTVMTPDPAAADAFATAVFVMGPRLGLEWVERQPDVEALVVDADGAVHRSSGWAALGAGLATPAAVTPPVLPAMRQEAARTAPAVLPPWPEGRPVLGSLVRVPAGEYLLGDEPAAVKLEAFRIDLREVTNREYAEFLAAIADDPARFDHPEQPAGKDHTPRYWREFRPPLFRKSGAAELAPFDAETFRRPEDPVVGVDWWDAFAYARWAGKRLPTAHEREAAARGSDGRAWPWGNSWDYARANTGGEKWGEKDGFIYAAPADSFPGGASPFGCLHMAGNVAEWTAEGFVAGGSSRSNPSGVRCAARELREPGYRSFDIGFRCAAGVDE